MQHEIEKKQKTNFWDLWSHYSKRNKIHLKRKFMEVTEMNYQTLNSLLTRRNFTIDEQKVWERLIGLPLDFTYEENKTEKN